MLLTLLGLFRIYSLIFDWQEFGEMFIYFLYSLPLGLILLGLSIYGLKNSNGLKRKMSILGLVVGILVLIPFIVYYHIFH